MYQSFAEANSSAPKTKPLGFDCPEYASEFRDRHFKVFSFDYPMLYWLRTLMQAECRIFDFGGHVGTHFYAYQNYLPYPRGLEWIVCDLPKITRVGNEIARERNARGLRFTNRMADAENADIFIAAGSLQYVESPSLASLLAALGRKPGHILVNKAPLYDGPQFVTLQNGGVAFHPQYVFNRAAFVESVCTAGYALVDSWSVDTHPGRIPGYPERSFPCHTGMYFTRQSAESR